MGYSRSGIRGTIVPFRNRGRRDSSIEPSQWKRPAIDHEKSLDSQSAALPLPPHQFSIFEQTSYPLLVVPSDRRSVFYDEPRGWSSSIYAHQTLTGAVGRLRDVEFGHAERDAISGSKTTGREFGIKRNMLRNAGGGARGRSPPPCPAQL